MIDLSLSDYIGIATSILSLVATVIVAFIQCRQGKKMADFEKRQDERDEKRLAESIESQAVSFISKYNKDRGLIPLCAVAALHDKFYHYSREMYREFCCMTIEVQNKVLEFCKLDLSIQGGTNESNLSFFNKCLNALESHFRKTYPDDTSPFYEGGKYIERSLERYASKKIPVKVLSLKETGYRPAYIDNPITTHFNVNRETCSYDECMTGVLSDFHAGRGSKHPITNLKSIYQFDKVEKEDGEVKACQFATKLAYYIAVFGDDEENSGKNYGAPGHYNGELIDTMEDLFLQALFGIYIHLGLSKKEC